MRGAAHDHATRVHGCYRCDLSQDEIGVPIPAPDCILGYSREALEQILAEDFDKFARWMRGQTGAICDGLAYDHETREFRETGCGPHGSVVYAHDLTRFLEGGPIVD